MNYDRDDNSFEYIFGIKISQSTHVSGDTLLDCTEYSAGHSYNGCVKKELVDLYEENLGCGPPLLAGNYSNICNKTFNLTTSEDAKIKHMFWDIYGTYRPTTCKVPCTKTTFEPYLKHEIGTNHPHNSFIFYIDPKVSVTRSVFSISTQTLLTRLGGSVSPSNIQ
jgi:hypothetical protein